MRFLIVISLFCFLGFYTQAQVKINVSVDKNPVAINENVRLEYSFSASPKQFIPPDLSSFQVMGAPRQTFHSETINGKRTQGLKLTYTLRPKKIGEIEIASVEVAVNGKKYKTQSIKLKVVGALGGAQNVDPNNPQAALQKGVFYRTLINKSSAYQGEAVVLTYKLYYNFDVSQISYDEFPKFNGFWSQEISLPANPNIKSEIYKGARYNTAILKQYLLIPQKSGPLDISQAKIEALVRVPSNKVDFFGRRAFQTVKHQIVAPAARVNIKALPQAGKPSDFSGAVGQYSFSAKLSKQEVEANNSVTLSIKLEGKGNLKLIDLPVVELPPDVESYDPKFAESVSVNASGMSGRKSAEYLLIPRFGGNYKIEPLSFNYFDIEKEKYVRKSSDDFNLKVVGAPNKNNSKGNTSGSSMPQSSEKQGVEYLAEDINHIRTDIENLNKSNSRFAGSYTHLGLGMISVLGFLFLFIFKKKKSSEESDEISFKAKQAGKMANKKLALAEQALAANNLNDFYSNLNESVYAYFSDRFNVRKGEMNQSKIIELAKEANAPQDWLDQFSALSSRIESAVYGGGKTEDHAELYKATVEVINKIDAV